MSEETKERIRHAMHGGISGQAMNEKKKRARENGNGGNNSEYADYGTALGKQTSQPSGCL